jgi:hypothetical protein
LHRAKQTQELILRDRLGVSASSGGSAVNCHLSARA